VGQALGAGMKSVVAEELDYKLCDLLLFYSIWPYSYSVSISLISNWAVKIGLFIPSAFLKSLKCCVSLFFPSALLSFFT
jgi:hypothetical protein